ncbi:hypothetical protein THOM_3066 [Trachipleistophora hominis]|uniref:Uncharacterized protein n=1 Tax=Trachipleistophora hominis TaxID=72359 RepID=L7JTD2_TRAHO|nr:hypothetical protein THOM_3066 [Trachipleistophora hominis]
MPSMNELILTNLFCDKNIIVNRLGNVNFLEITFSKDQNVNALNFDGYLLNKLCEENLLLNNLQGAMCEIVLFKDYCDQIKTAMHKIVQNFIDAFYQNKLISQIFGFTFEEVRTNTYDI